MNKTTLFLIALALLSGCSSQEISPTMTHSVTSTSVPTTTSTAVPTATVTPSPSPMPFEAFNLIYAYIAEGNNSSEIHIIDDETSRIVPIQGKTTEGSRAGNLIAISPDGSTVIAEILRDNITTLLLIDLQQESPISSVLAELPANSAAIKLGFSPSGRWLYVKYDAFGSGPFVIRTRLYDLINSGYKQINNCFKIIGFSIDENTVYCSSTNSSNVPKPIQHNLITSEQKPFFEIPYGKQFQVNKTQIYPVAFLFEKDQVILEGNGQTFLMDDLADRGETAYWSADDIRDLLNQTVIANDQLNLLYLPEPNGDRIAITGVFSSGSPADKTCIHPQTYSFVASPNDVHSPNSLEARLNGIYALDWAPDGSAIVGIIFNGESNCRLSLIDPITMNEIAVVKDDLAMHARFWFNFIRGIDAVWLP